MVESKTGEDKAAQVHASTRSEQEGEAITLPNDPSALEPVPELSELLLSPSRATAGQSQSSRRRGSLPAVPSIDRPIIEATGEATRRLQTLLPNRSEQLHIAQFRLSSNVS